MSSTSERHDRNLARFDADNPKVWKWYVTIAKRLREWQDRGSSEQIIQILRWEIIKETKTQEIYKISNNHRKRYAMKLVRTHPEFLDWFRFRGEGKP